MKVCKSVAVMVKGSKTPKLANKVVEPGMDLGDCLVTVAIPSKSVVRMSTKIIRSPYREYSYTEVGDDVIVIERSIDNVTNMYVYPKDVWYKVLKLYVEPLKRGEPPGEHLLLIGAPGTGKSVLARLVSRMLAVNTIELKVTEVKSRYYGETEKNMEKKLNEAVEAEPSVLIIDDAEIFITSRALTTGYSSGVEATETAIKDILFAFLERVIDERRCVLVIATTNFSPKAIDEALVRGGRFGEPIFIPLPSFNALYEYAKWIVGDERLAKELAYKCMSRGLTIADLKTMVKMLRCGLNPDFKRFGGRGYSRLYAEPVKEIVENNELKELISRYYDFSKDRPTTLWFDAPFQVGVAVLAQIFMLFRRPALVITDVRYPDEFAYSLDVMKAVGVVPTYLPKDVQVYIRMNSQQPLVFTGREVPGIELCSKFLDLTEMANKIGGIEPLIAAVSNYHNIQLPPDRSKEADRIFRAKGARVIDILSMMVSCGTLTDSALSRLMYSS